MISILEAMYSIKDKPSLSLLDNYGRFNPAVDNGDLAARMWEEPYTQTCACRKMPPVCLALS